MFHHHHLGGYFLFVPTTEEANLCIFVAAKMTWRFGVGNADSPKVTATWELQAKMRGTKPKGEKEVKKIYDIQIYIYIYMCVIFRWPDSPSTCRKSEKKNMGAFAKWFTGQISGVFGFREKNFWRSCSPFSRILGSSTNMLSTSTHQQLHLWYVVIVVWYSSSSTIHIFTQRKPLKCINLRHLATWSVETSSSPKLLQIQPGRWLPKHIYIYIYMFFLGLR